jgi:hypothetical protein
VPIKLLDIQLKIAGKVIKVLPSQAPKKKVLKISKIKVVKMTTSALLVLMNLPTETDKLGYRSEFAFHEILKINKSLLSSLLQTDDSTHKQRRLLRSQKQQKKWTIHGEIKFTGHS